MKPKQLTLLSFGLSIITSSILARTIHRPDFSRYYQNADQVILAQAKSSQGKKSYEIQRFYKGQDKALPENFCSCKDVGCIQASYAENEYYILFVENDSLSRVYHIGLTVDTILWRSFFLELEHAYQVNNLQNRHQSYARWLLKYFQKDDFRMIIREEIKWGNSSLFPWRELCRDIMHLKDGFHDECQRPALFNKSQQYHLLQILNDKQLFLDTGIFMDRLDLISAADLQKFFYANIKIFFEKVDHKNSNDVYQQTLKEWDVFFGNFVAETTNEELRMMLLSFTNTPENLFRNQEYLKNENNIIVKLKAHIWSNSPMFTDVNEEKK